MLKSADQLNALRVGADKGTTNEITRCARIPGRRSSRTTTRRSRSPRCAGTVQAITQDGPKLIGLLANVPDKQNYEIPAFTISNDYMGVGVPKGETRLLGFVNDTLEAGANGRAVQIYDAWFGPTTKTPLTRIFRIGDKT